MGRPEIDARVVDATATADARAFDGFLADAHATGVASCVRNLGQYALDEARRELVIAIYDRYKHCETDHWTRMLDSLHHARAIDSRVFQVWNDRRDTDASFDELRLVKAREGAKVDAQPTASDDDATDDASHAPTPFQLHSAIEELGDVDDRQDRDLRSIVEMVEWLYEYVADFDLDMRDLRLVIGSMNAQLHNARGARSSKQVEVQYRLVDDHGQIQFCGPSTFIVKDLLKPLGATWIATSRMWVLSKERGEQFMQEHATQFAFSRVA